VCGETASSRRNFSIKVGRRENSEEGPILGEEKEGREMTTRETFDARIENYRGRRILRCAKPPPVEGHLKQEVRRPGTLPIEPRFKASHI
jgi:hypothetical protein